MADLDGPIKSIIKQHLMQALLVVAFGAWSIAVWSTKAVVEQYLTVQTNIENNQAHIMNMIAQVRSDLTNERQTRREELLLVRERQDRNTSMVNDHDLRLRKIEMDVHK